MENFIFYAVQWKSPDVNFSLYHGRTQTNVTNTDEIGIQNY